MRITREQLIEGIVTPPDYRTSFTRTMNYPDYRFPINRTMNYPDYRVNGGVQGEKETRYHSLSILDKLKNKPQYAGKITPEVRGVPTDGSKEWLDSMSGAKTTSAAQYGNYGQQANDTPFMQLSRPINTQSQRQIATKFNDRETTLNQSQAIMNHMRATSSSNFRR